MNERNTLFSRMTLGNIELKNRIVMAPMGDGLANNDGNVTEEMIAYYTARAASGVGLIYVGSTCVRADDGNKPDQHKIFREQHLRGLRRLAEAMHRYDSKVIVQLVHTGRLGNPAVLGHETVAPSPIPVTNGEIPGIPRELTIAEIRELEQDFINAAVLAKRAGIDGVELHAGHGYLLNQFHSPFTNHRTDEYGGSTENRTRFMVNILRGIRENLGPDFPISVRLSVVELLDGGLTMDESVKIAKIAESNGATVLSISAGTLETQFIQTAGPEYEEGYLLPYVKEIKQNVSIPVAAVGRIRHFDFADRIIRDGTADLVLFARPFIADPNFARKITEGRSDEVRHCLSCGYCFDTNKNGGIRCAVNPTQGLESWYKELLKNGNHRPVAVIGGGPSGCEAARILAMRGFRVTLFEQNAYLGGQTVLAAIPSNKGDILNLQQYYTTILPRLGVDIRLSTTVQPNMIYAINPYAVFLATGSIPCVPVLPGTVQDNVMTAHDLLIKQPENIRNCRVLIAGIGETGIDTAAWLLNRGCTVEMLDMKPDPRDQLLRTRKRKYDALIRKGVTMHPGCKLIGIDGRTTVYRRLDGSFSDTTADYIILAVGEQPNRRLWSAMRNVYGLNAQLIGNAEHTGLIHDAVFAGFNAAWNLDNPSDEL